MKIVFHIFFCFICMLCPAQNKKIDEQITKLNNEQFVIDHEHKASFSMRSNAARKLIKIGKPAVKKLIAALDDENRNIMAHLVLCHIYFRQASFAGPKMVTEDGEHVNKYFLGEEHGVGLILSEIIEGDRYRLTLREKDLNDIKEYWKKKSAS